MSKLKSNSSKSLRTICEVHREIYDELIEMEGTEKAIELLKEAYECGKKIAGKLRKYCGLPGYLEEMDYPLNHNQFESIKKRANRT